MTTTNPNATHKSATARRFWLPPTLGSTTALLACLSLLSGCWLLAPGCPSTESRLSNDTATAVTVSLVLDRSRCKLDHSNPDAAREWLEGLSSGEGVSLVAMDLERLTGTYRIEPAGFMIAHSSLGFEPYFPFNRLDVSSGNEKKSLISLRAIEKEFKPTNADTSNYAFVLAVSDLF